jgi:hypothetical protein
MLWTEQKVKPDTERLRAYNHVDYRKNSQLLRALFKDYCVIHDKDCGNIEIHHNDRNRHNNNLTNLIPLCKNAHRQVHMSNWKFDGMKSLIVQKLQFMAYCIKAGKSY